MVYVTQRTNRHIIKELDTSILPATYTGKHFGDFGVFGGGTTRLAYPWAFAVDIMENFYICDTNNARIVKLSKYYLYSDMVYTSSYSTELTVGVPYAILYDEITNNIYIVGVFQNREVRIERLTTDFLSLKVSNNLLIDIDEPLLRRPTGICRGFTSDTFIVIGANLNLLVTTETSNFSQFDIYTIHGESSTGQELNPSTLYNSIIKHSNGDLYLNNGQKILRVNSSFVNVGDSKPISKSIFGLKEGSLGSLLIYIADSQTLVRYSENLNFVEEIYASTGSTISDDAYEIMDFVEVDIV